MQSAKVDIFFSCSFADADKDVNEFFMAICRALDMIPTNVSTGSASTPPQVAKDKIAAAQALVAICTKRDELKNGEFVMPQAVHDEISFAFGTDTPVLMIKESGVILAGFKSNFGTYLEFDRLSFHSPDFIQKAVEAIHCLKLGTLGPHQLGAQGGMTDAYADYVHHLIELKPLNGEFIWQYSTSKKLVFNHPSKRGFPSSVWTVVPQDLAESAPLIDYEFVQNSSSRSLKLIDEVEEHSSQCVKTIIKPSPAAEEGDFVDYSTSYRSAYLNPTWTDQAPSSPPIHLDGGDFFCADGLVFIHRTKHAIVEFRFPKEYGMAKSDVYPFVGSYTSSIDYEVSSERSRANIRVEEFAGNLVLRMELESPLPGHIYGFAWNPKERPKQDSFSAPQVTPSG